VVSQSSARINFPDTNCAHTEKGKEIPVDILRKVKKIDIVSAAVSQTPTVKG
jgi:hypothetical protein